MRSSAINKIHDFHRHIPGRNTRVAITIRWPNGAKALLRGDRVVCLDRDIEAVFAPSDQSHRRRLGIAIACCSPAGWSGRRPQSFWQEPSALSRQGLRPPSRLQ